MGCTEPSGVQLKNKARNAAKNRQRRALKKTRRRKGKKRKPPAPTPSVIPKGAFPDDERAFWIAHGVNFLHSNFDEGVWNPLFPEVYEGKPIDMDRISNRLVAFVGGAEELTPEQQVVLGYAFQDRLAQYAFKLEAERRLQEKGDTEPEVTARLPHQPVVWELFHMLDGLGIQKEDPDEGKDSEGIDQGAEPSSRGNRGTEPEAEPGDRAGNSA